MMSLDRDLLRAAMCAVGGAGIVLLAAGLALSRLKPRSRRGALLAFDRAWARLARRRRASLMIVGLVALVPGLTWLAVAGVPVPRVQDEFAYLLAADTFARGRLANPPVPPDLRPFVDTVHVIAEPTYASKYPPAQGLTLALGQRLVGQPIVGVWLTLALACAAVAWALYQALPPRWALLGGLLLTLHPIVWRWAWDYWGGGVALLGGALVVGGGYAALKRRHAWGAYVAGVGAGVLALSRPYEGLLLIVAAGVWPALDLARHRLAARHAARLTAAVLAGALPLLGWLAYYQYRTTGSPWVSPYDVWNREYAEAPAWLVLPPSPPRHHRSPALASFHRWERAQWEGFRGAILKTALAKVRDGLVAFILPFPPVWPAVLVAAGALFRSAALRQSALSLALFGAGVLIEKVLLPHYYAPVVTLATIVLTVAIARALYARRWRRPGTRIAAAGGLLLLLTVPACQLSLHVPQREAARKPWSQRRAEIQRSLESLPGRHLVFVRYSAAHSVHREWVYNGADLEGAKVLWVHALGPKHNRRLAGRLSGRQPWLVDADDRPPRLRPFALTRRPPAAAAAP